ncbi:unnamed protein product [Urochloa humidicola]
MPEVEDNYDNNVVGNINNVDLVITEQRKKINEQRSKNARTDHGVGADTNNVDLVITGVEHSTVEEDQQEDLTNWIRPGVEGIGGFASDIENAVPMDEPDHDSVPDDPDEHDTYIGDGVVARLDGEDDDDDDFFV